MRAFCDIRPQKKQNHRRRLTSGVNIIDYLGEFQTPTPDLTTMKLYVNRAISEIKLRYMCMDVKDFYLNNHMDRLEYRMIQISMIPQ